MTRFNRAWLVAAAVVASAVWAPQAQAQATTTTTNDTFDTAGFGFDPISGEPIFFEGQAHILTTITVNKTGVHVKFHFQLYGQGDGVFTGTQYIYQDVYNDTFNYSGNGAIEETVVENFHIVSQGGAPNYYGTARIHYTVNANGVLTVDRVDVNFP